VSQVTESDINFVIRVRVTNDVLQAGSKAQFNLVDLPDKSKFAEIYGDTFISSFLRGGEFVSVINVKASDPSAIPEIRARLGAAFNAARNRDVAVDLRSLGQLEVSLFVKSCGASQSDSCEVFYRANSSLNAEKAL
jgi:hypothetical protein